MKIGQVSRKYNISVDHIYYYIRYGLLVPPRPASQYDFDSQTLQDLDLILELKEMGFSLPEIHKILSLQRISGLTDSSDIQEVLQMYSMRREHCVEEKQRIEKMIHRMDSKIEQLNQRINEPSVRIGLPIRMLDLLCCPHCGKTLEISDVDMNLTYIFNGKMHCSCGYQAQIQDGILLTPNRNRNLQDTPDITRELYKDLPPSLISLFQRSYNWMITQLEHLPLKNAVVMETYINAWFFLHNHQQYLDKTGRYIIVDKYPETLAMYKKLIEQQNYQLDILYIADSSTQLPLKPGIVDINIDFFAVNEHNFYHNTFLLKELRTYFHNQTLLLGTYFYLEKGPVSMKNYLTQYPEAWNGNFNHTNFLEALRENGYRLSSSEECGYTKDSGNNLGFGFHQKGEKMHLLSYLAK